jgi:hypothetical protein
MEVRNLFDVILVVSVVILLYVEVSVTQPSLRDLSLIVEVLTGLSVAVYLVVAGILGLLFVFVITVYIPQKQSQRTTR